MSKDTNTQVQARDEIAKVASSILVWEKKNADHTATVRKSSFADLLATCKAAGKLMDEDISAVCSTFAINLRAGGIKASTITTRKSELRRILENLDKVPADCGGWNAAIKSIRSTTADPLELVRDECEAKLASIEKAHEAINAAVAGYQDMLNEARPKGTPAFTTEQVAAMVRDAIAAKNASAQVQPVNVAQMLKPATPASTTPTMNNMKAQA